MRKISSRRRIKSLESRSVEVLAIWRLNSQSGTQEVLKIGLKCFERGLRKFSRWNARKLRIAIKMILYCKKNLKKWDKEVLEVE